MEIQEVNELIRSQEADYNEIRRVLTNIKKDSPTRKTEKYINERKKTLNQVFQRVQENHLRLQEQEVLSTHKYITTNYFANIKKYYDEGIKYLEECEERLQHVQSVYEPRLLEEDEDKDGVSSPKLFIQLFRMSQITKKISQAKESVTQNKPIWHLQTLLQTLQKQWLEIEETHIGLLMAESTLDNSYFRDNCFEKTQKDYDITTELLEERIFQISDEKVISTKSSGKLPRISIPIFTGDYDSWETFQDLFRKIIHEDNSISSTEKMQYLKTHVKGDAARLIRHLTISEINYETAWKLLTQRYEDERMIATKFIDKLLDLPKIQRANAAQLRDMHDTINECLEALKNQRINTSSWGPLLIRIVSRKWDEETNTKYEDQLQNRNKIQSFDEMMKFMENRFNCLKSFDGSTSYTNTSKQLSRDKTEKYKRCWFCQKNDHIIHHCPSFKALSVNDRYKAVTQKRMCKRCLNHDDQKQCVSAVYKQCEICQHKGHNVLLHQSRPFQNNDNAKKYTQKNTGTEKSQNIATSNLSATKNDTKNTTLLATAIVRTTSYDGMPQLLRVLCDQGSEASFCTEEVAQLLSYPRQKIQAEIKGIGDEKPKTSNYTINITLQPRYSSDYKLPVTLIVLPKLTSSLPRNDLQQLQEKILDNALIADPTYYKKGPIDIILGAQEYSRILLQGFERLRDGIIAQNTELGWILSGFYPKETKNGVKILSMVACTEDVRQLTKFWELEEIPQDYKLTQDDQTCENYYKETTVRNSDGTYTVRLPLKDSNLNLNLNGESRRKAAARLLQLERQFAKNEKLRQQYIDFMNEYLLMGHMRKVATTNYNSGKYYIPHQAVIKEDSLSTKLRVVFDASSKSSTKISLNDNMYKGPRLQQDLSTILLRWRKHKFAFMADIMKMYRFIKINELDVTHQRILWRFSPKHAISEYELTTVTYGTTSAPYLAVRTLQQLAIDEQNNYPIASQATLQDFYVDDILSGDSQESAAKELQSQLISMLNKGGFKLRKWSSNSSELLENIPVEDKDDQLLKLPLDESRKSLGITWSPREDSFYFQITITENKKPTKRFIMSEVAKIFDPLGWLAPIIIKMKLLIQELWTNDIGWDQPVDDILQKKWVELQNQLKSIEEIKVPRWCYITGSTEIELYGFSDASEKAYGAVVYSRVKIDNIYYVTLLQAKSKVAPKKQKTTLPRLELCAALLLAGLMEKVKEALNCKNITISCWTDSMITLGWVRGEPERWQTFVANRVSQIKQLLPNAEWNHVISADNPADIISRGLEPEKMVNYSLWWNGPHWLKTNQIPFTKRMPQPNQETKLCHTTTAEIEKNDLWNRFSSLDKMIRVLSYCYKFTNKQTTNKLLTCNELNVTLKRILLKIQQQEFKDDLKTIQGGQPLKKNKTISTLDPFIDEDGLLRVGGRLQNSELPYNQKHPILLPYNHHVTSLIIQDAHLKTLHGGNKLTLAYLRQRYWIISGKRKVKSLINKCVRCIRYKADTNSQKMGILPKARVTQSHPFSYTGVDYAGPIQTRTMKGRGHKSYKSYIAVFVCLATKAIHLELVGDLTTETFIAALRRFMARRGHVLHMYSDNATNFVGAANFLHQEILQITQSPQFQNTITNIGTQWHFIPPSSPHFGGIWEAGVKSVKHHLRRVIGDSTLTYEEMTTFLHQIEACLNSRPLCAQTENINDNTILTPSHFLIGREAVGTPDPIENINTDLVNRWKQIQKMKKDFWNSWTKDYLHQLQQRYKWKQAHENAKIGTVVLIKDDNINPSKWPLAKITEVHPGDDGVVRVVTLQKSTGACHKRSIHTLIPLPVNENIEIDTTSKDRQTPTQCNISTATINKKGIRSPKSWIKGLLVHTIVILLIGTVSTTPTYTLKSLNAGLYVEEIGTTTINRGTFRIETDYERGSLEIDHKKIEKITTQFQQLCKDTQYIMDETHCNEFYHHLNEEKTKFETTKEYLTEIKKNRKKRGFLGQLLTSVFGVNDEVYRDIDTLNNNQQKLIDAANHQTKIMISTIAGVNQTEEQIQKKLEKFQAKLNEAISFMNNHNVWYKSIDKNHIKIQVMQTYELANNFINEIMDYYKGLLEIYLQKATIYSILTPKHISNIIKMANQKLPSNLKIIQDQIIHTGMNVNTTHIRVYAYFPIHDITKYTLIHVTPIPERKTDGSFECLTIQQTFMGFDYNNERYFELNQEEFKDCLHSDAGFVCYPVAVKNMQLNKNCIVEQLFRTENYTHTQCTSKTYKISTDVVWKQLYMQNTWLFITTKSVAISIVCDGQRKEITIQDVGVLHISENCVIKTLNNILAAKRTTTVTVLASYAKTMNFSINTQILPTNINDISKEELVLDKSKGVFDHLVTSETNLQTELQNTIWKQLESHTYIASITTSLVIISLACVLIYFGPQVLNKLRATIAARRKTVPPVQQPTICTSQTQQTQQRYGIPHSVPTRQSQQTEQGQARPYETIELYQMESRS